MKKLLAVAATWKRLCSRLSAAISSTVIRFCLSVVVCWSISISSQTVPSFSNCVTERRLTSGRVSISRATMPTNWSLMTSG